jgi:hypothetical protein
MPFKDSTKHRDYYRDYMRRRRAGQKAQPKPSAADNAGLARIRELEAELARERARREAPELLDAAATKHFSEKGTLRIDDAIRVHKARLDKQFEQRVREEVRRRIDAADDATRAQNKELRAEIWSLTRAIQRGKIFTPEQYKAIIRCLHPDSNPSSEVKHKAFLLFEPKKLALTGEK